MKNKPLLNVTISGDKWKVYLVSDHEFDHEWGKETLATTVYNHNQNCRMLFFKPSGFNKGTVIHEVTHAFFSYQYLDSARLKPVQLEEIFCDFMANRMDQVRKVSNTIYKKLRNVKTIL